MLKHRQNWSLWLGRRAEGGGSWDSEGGRRREQHLYLSFFADHAAKQPGEAHASLISITLCFQRGHRQSNKEGLRGKILKTCKTVASAKRRKRFGNNGGKIIIDYQHLGMLRRGGRVAGNSGPQQAEEV